MAGSGSDYVPLTNVFSPLDYNGYRRVEHAVDSFQDVQDSPEIHYDPQRPDKIPLIDAGTRQAFSIHSPDYFDHGRFGLESPPTASSQPPGNSARSPPSPQSPKVLKRKPVSSSYSLPSLRDFHKSIDDPNRPHAKRYDFRRTRDKLFVSCSSQWLVTVLIAGAVAGALGGYQRYQTISPEQKHVFNAIITGLLIALGINLASSLRSYADLMRWRLVSGAWLTLREFDLILGCQSQLKVLELFFTSKRKRFVFIPTQIQIICASWLFANVATQILVAMIGLTYSLDQSDFDALIPGNNISIVNMSTIADRYGISSGSSYAQEFAAQAYGVQGQDYPLLSVDDPVYDSWSGDGNFQILFASLDYSTTVYRFIDNNPDESASVQSNRTITSTVFCDAFNVIEHQTPYYAGQQIPGDLLFYTATNGKNATLYVRDWARGAVTYVSDTLNPCGPRCNLVYVYQAPQERTSPNQLIGINQDVIFQCNSTVSEVGNATSTIQDYVLGDVQARYIAGAIGWTGYVASLGDGAYEHLEYRLYSNESYWSPPYELTLTGIQGAAGFVGQFAMAAVAAMDTNGPQVTVADGFMPVRTLKVAVQWGDAAALLGAIVSVQFLALLLVITFANKAIVQDDSYLAISKLLAPTVMKIGHHGSVLRGDEIAYHPAFPGGYKIFYGCREQAEEIGRPILKADIIEQGQGIPRSRRPFKDGIYD